MTQSRSHSSDLTVFPFTDNDFKPLIWNRLALPDWRDSLWNLGLNGLRLRLLRFAIPKRNALTEVSKTAVVDFSFYLDPIVLSHLEPGMTDMRLQCPGIGE